MVRVHICDSKTNTASRALCVGYFELPFYWPCDKYVSYRL